MGIGVLIIAIGLIYKKRDVVQKALARYKNRIINHRSINPKIISYK